MLDYLATRQSPDRNWGQNFAAAADHGDDRGASYCTGLGRGWPAEPGGPGWLRRAMNQAAQPGMPPLMAANCGNFWQPTVKL